MASSCKDAMKGSELQEVVVFTATQLKEIAFNVLKSDKESHCSPYCVDSWRALDLVPTAQAEEDSSAKSNPPSIEEDASSRPAGMAHPAVNKSPIFIFRPPSSKSPMNNCSKF
jgi:hypothetical protein